MEPSEPNNIINEDWRLQAITTLAEDFSFPNGPIHKKGAVVVLTAQTKFNKKNISFGLPNVTAMFLNFSNKLWQESDEYFKNESNFIEPASKFMPVNFLNVSSNQLLFDALEKRMGAIVFAYSAIESFANQVIPEGYIFK